MKLKVINQLTFAEWFALRERIAGHVRRAAAHRQVIDYIAPGIVATRTDARIPAALIDTRFCTWAFRIRGTFWSTRRVRISNVIR